MADKKMRLLYFTAESWPTHRADVAVLFAKYLPRFGVTVDLVTKRERGNANQNWSAGDLLLFDVPEGMIARHFSKSYQILRIMLTCKAAKYDAIQVRDMAVIGLFGLIIAKTKGIRFIYWLSYPQSEGQILRAQARGIRAGLRYILPLLQGLLGKFLLYSWVLPHADHVFVQSDKMREDIAAKGIEFSKMTPVPMGVDFETARRENIVPSNDPRLKNKRVIVYLGTLNQERQIDKLFVMLKLSLLKCTNILLVLVGDTEDKKHRAWLEARAREQGVEDAILWVGWVTTEIAWRYVCAAEVGISVIPRGFLLDVGSPTKVVEYFALGVPVLANDNPDQQKIISESKSGVCLAYTPEAFSSALLQLLATIENEDAKNSIVENGVAYIKKHRSYETIASQLAKQYQQVLY